MISASVKWEEKVKNKEDRLKRQRAEKLKDELVECTYSPILNSNSKNLARRARQKNTRAWEDGSYVQGRQWQTGPWYDARQPLYPLFPAVTPNRKDRFAFRPVTRKVNQRKSNIPITTVRSFEACRFGFQVACSCSLCSGDNHAAF